MKFQSVGLIVNPVAGLGARRNLQAARVAIQALGIQHVITGPGQLGEQAVPNAQILKISNITGREASQRIARDAAESGVEALIVVGGDGTMADTAFAIRDCVSRPPILGIGAGSINAGELVTCLAEDAEKLSVRDLRVKSINALQAGCNDIELAFAFNDIVISTTLVGTIDGEVCDLDANDFIDGAKVRNQPQPVGSEATLVSKISGDRKTEIARGPAVGTVIAGFAQQDCFFGKAIVGGVILSTMAGSPAGCLVCDQPLVRTELTPQDIDRIEPVKSTYVSLNEDEIIHVTGIGPPAVLCADGNPLKRLSFDDKVQIVVRPKAVQVLRLA